MSLGCHNVIMSNHSTFVLGYLLLQGYDTTGNSYLLRLAGLSVGALATCFILWRTTGKSITNVRSDIFSRNLTFTLCVHGADPPDTWCFYRNAVRVSDPSSESDVGRDRNDVRSASI